MSGAPPPRPARPVAYEVSTLLTARPTGIGVYAQGLLRAMAALRPERPPCQIYRWTRAARRGLVPAPELGSRPFSSGRRLHAGFGLVHALDTRLPRGFRGPLVATLYDVTSALPLAEELHLSSPRFLARKRRDYGRIARLADLVITLSEETRGRFLSLAEPRGRVVVIPPGIGEELRAAGRRGADRAELAALGLRGRYLLWVGALCPRKNLLAAVEAFARARATAPDLELAVVGEPGTGWEEDPARSRIAQLGDPVRLLGYLPRSSLAAVYAGAEALLYLSHYEGYGLPVIEAMAAGAPVIASARGGIPEAAGGAALLVDPDRPEEIDAALGRVLGEPAVAARLRRMGLERVRALTWEAAARAVDAAHAEALAL